MTVLPKISAITFRTGDVLYECDDFAEEVFFISTGEFQVLSKEGKCFSTYKDGDTIGAIEVLYDLRRIGTAICTIDTCLYSLDHVTYLQINSTYPQLLIEVK